MTFAGVSLRVPAAWPVIRLADHPGACPDLGRHAVYLGRPGPAPHCPAMLRGKTESAWIERADPASPDSRLATRAVRASGQAARVNPDPAVTHTITEILPGPGAEVSLSYGHQPALARQIQASIRVQAGPQARLRHPALTRPLGLPAASTAQSLYRGAGFDACGAPALSVMKNWLASPYRAIGIYIGGLNRGCAQANLTASWITSIQQQGWHYFPFYVGPQASCVSGQHDSPINPAKAASQGKSSADDAVAQAKALGIPAATPIIYDMEAYSGCTPQVITFLSAWDSELHAKGYKAGVYESFSNIKDLVSASKTITEPDLIHYADWDKQATTQSSYMPAMWTRHQRIHQYQGGHNQTWGGSTLNIDSDQVDAVLGGSGQPVTPVIPGAPAAAHTAFRPAVGLDGGSTPDWFARSATRTLVHDSQQAGGGWSRVTTVGTSPTTLASNPAVAAAANGRLTVTARTSAGQLAYAWQTATGGWKWASPVPAAGSPAGLTGDPGAARRPNGEVELFATGRGGAVQTTHQTAVNSNTSWSAWKSIGGSCASGPVPFTTPAKKLEVFCRTLAGTVAFSQWTGQAWTAWQPAGASPAGLAATPAVVATTAGQTELVVSTTAGGLDLAWQNPSTGRWTWAAPLASSTVRRSPAAVRWSDGKVRVIAQLTSRKLGVISQSGGSATAKWSGWTTIRGGVLGSPVAWVNPAGIPGVAALNTSAAMASASYQSGAWTAMARLGGSF